MLKYEIVLAVVGLAAVLVVSCLNFSLDVAAYQAHRMAIIEDLNADSIAIGPTCDEVWNKLVELYHSKEEMWIGGVIEVHVSSDPRYRWGFRFKPETVAVAEVTAEALQTTISDISENLGYWLTIGQAYVFAKVANYSTDLTLLVNVDLSPDTVTVGDNVTIFAFVTDDGGSPIEGATVTAAIGDLEVLFLLSDLENGNYQGAIDTSIVGEGAYEIVVTAQKEGYEPSLSSRMVTVTARSDINHDRTVNIVDISIACGAFGSTSADPDWNAICDLNSDEVVNIQDLALVARDYGYKDQNLELKTIVLAFLRTTDVPNGVWDGSVGVKEIYDHKLGGKVMIVEYTTSTAGHPDFFLDTIEHHIAVITLNFNREVVSAFCVWSNVHDSKVWDLLNRRWVARVQSQEEGFGIYLREDDRLVVSDEDVVSYNQTSHEIKLTKLGAGKIEALNISVFGDPFVVKIDGEEIYSGTFMTPISSLPIAPSEAVIVTLVQNDTIRIQMGYPGTEPIDRDPRNDSRVSDFFQKTGMLVQ